MKSISEPDFNNSLQRLLAEADDTDRDLLNAAKAFYKSNCDHSSIREAVRVANDDLGTDFATALLYAHFEFKLCLESIPDTTLSGPLNHEPSSTAPVVVIAPGAFHREHPEVGGDGRLVKLLAERNGWECVSLDTESLGTLDVNASAIVKWLDKNRERRIILVSLSKGTADVMVALAERLDLAEMIDAWISVSGILLGTKMSNWLLDRKRLRPALWFMLWRYRADVQAVKDLRAGEGEQLPCVYDQLIHTRAAEIPTFHIAGFPLKRHLSNLRSRLWHRRFQREGPNDSVILLEDLLGYHGTVIPVWGADHYLKSPCDPTKALEAIIDLVANRSNAKQS